MELPLSPLADISDGCSFTSISLSRVVRLCVCRNKNNVQETAINATSSADLKGEGKMGILRDVSNLERRSI